MGGHGGLNILPQKSWNVYNVRNQNIVRRDEARFAEEQKEAERLALRDEQRERLTVMRASHEPSPSHYNLFQEEEMNAVEFERKQRKAAQEKKEQEKDTWYLSKGGSVHPWYQDKKVAVSGPERKRPAHADPMAVVNALLKGSERPPINPAHQPSKAVEIGPERQRLIDHHHSSKKDKTKRHRSKHERSQVRDEKKKKRRRHREESSSSDIPSRSR